MKFSSIAITSCFAALWAAAPVTAKFAYGVPWAADNRWAGSVTNKTVSWYHHWEDGPVSNIHKKVEYVPMYWGPKKKGDWHRRKAYIEKHKPKNILAFNEPDIESQAAMTPSEAVSEFMKELQPFADKGINVSSPQMVYDIGWLESFMDKCKAKGCKISFVALHWYGGYQDIDAFTRWIDTVYNKFKLPIWVTEFGVTAASNPNADQVKDFMEKAIDWMGSKDYVVRAAWNGCYNMHNPPDEFATPLNAFFNNGGALRDTAHTWLAGKSMIPLTENGNGDGNNQGSNGNSGGNSGGDSDGDSIWDSIWDSIGSHHDKDKRQLAHAVMQKRRGNYEWV